MFPTPLPSTNAGQSILSEMFIIDEKLVTYVTNKLKTTRVEVKAFAPKQHLNLDRRRGTIHRDDRRPSNPRPRCYWRENCRVSEQIIKAKRREREKVAEKKKNRGKEKCKITDKEKL